MILGIHKDLLSFTVVIVTASALIIGMGLLLLANVFMPEALSLEPLDLSSKIAFILFGGMFVIFGFMGGIATFLHNLKISRAVLGTNPKPVSIRLTEEKWSDSTTFIVVVNGLHYCAKRPGWFKQDLLETTLEAEAYFDPQGIMAAVRLHQGLIWITNSRGYQSNE